MYFKLFKSLFFVFLFFSIENVGFAQELTYKTAKDKLASEKIDTLKLKYLQYLSENSPDGEWEIYNKELKLISQRKLADTLKINFDKKLKNTYLKYYAISINNDGYTCLQKGDLVNGLKYFSSAVNVFQKINDLELTSSTLSNIGSIYVQQGKIPKALEVFHQCLNCQKKIKDLAGIANTLNNLAYIYQDQGDIVKALENHFYCLKVREQLKDSSGIAYSFINIGSLYSSQNDSAKNFEYYFKGLSLFKKMGNNRGIAQALNNIGGSYDKYKKYSLARDYFYKGLEISEKNNTKQITAQILVGIGESYRFEKNYKKADEFLLKSLEFFKEIGDKKGVSNTLYKISANYYAQNNYSKAIELGKKALAIARELGVLESIRSATELLYNSYKKTNKTSEALIMLENFIQVKDSIKNQKNRSAIIYNEFKYEFGHKEELMRAAAKSETEKYVIQSREQKRQRNIIIYSALLLIIFGLIFLFFVLRSKKKIELANEIITIQKQIVEHKHKEITDSINYAERIQRSFLATNQMLNSNLNDFFILFKPKDIVSGDFYWASLLNNNNFAIAIADSTGHGVPGAIMSLLNITSLDKAVEHNNEPSEIMNATRKIIIERLKNDGSVDGGKDGMDVSLMVYNFAKKTLTASSANNSIWIVRAENIIEIKPDKMPVGKHDKQHVSFTQQEIQLQSGDMVYAATDGFGDQFGGSKGKKFMSRNLKALLLANAYLPITEQKIILEEAFNSWRGSNEQVDDVTLFGIRV